LKPARDLLEDILEECRFLINPGIPWRRIAGMRDRLIHAYFAIDYAILFDVTTTSVPELARQIDELLKSMEID
jgi:uncharacterized protein with HEPN domain